VLNQPVRQYIETQLRNADLQIQLNHPAEAQRFLDAARAIDPSYPGLIAIEARLHGKTQ
jgi:hypothetical protein